MMPSALMRSGRGSYGHADLTTFARITKCRQCAVRWSLSIRLGPSHAVAPRSAHFASRHWRRAVGQRSAIGITAPRYLALPPVGAHYTETYEPADANVAEARTCFMTAAAAADAEACSGGGGIGASVLRIGGKRPRWGLHMACDAARGVMLHENGAAGARQWSARCRPAEQAHVTWSSA